MFSPAVFRSLKIVSDNARNNGKWAGICGELGGMKIAVPALIGLGIEELSMTSQLLPETISMIRSLT